MIRYLNKDQVAERIGVKPRTAATMMLEMNPVIISGNTRKRIRVSEESLDQWMIAHSNGKRPPVSRATGTTRRIARR